MKIDSDYMVRVVNELCNIPSPTGMTGAAIDYCEEAFGELGLRTSRTVKGGLLATWDGERDDAPVALTAHVDTLGAMVKEIKGNGRLKLTKLGGYAWQTVETEGVTVFMLDGEGVRGTILPVQASAHVHGSKVNSQRGDDDIELRLDAKVASDADVRALGIEIGDYVAFDARVEVSESGFIRSRHLDDKASVAAILGAIRAMQAAGSKPAQRTSILISNYEEVGHGASSGFPDDIVALVTVDMAAIGAGQSSDEFSCTICIKDSGGPYHIDLTRKLIKLAEGNNIAHQRDIYPFYGSDGEAYWRAGGDVRVALIGPGVDASHSYERTHRESLAATAALIAAYLQDG